MKPDVSLCLRQKLCYFPVGGQAWWVLLPEGGVRAVPDALAALGAAGAVLTGTVLEIAAVISTPTITEFLGALQGAQ